MKFIFLASVAELHVAAALLTHVREANDHLELDRLTAEATKVQAVVVEAAATANVDKVTLAVTDELCDDLRMAAELCAEDMSASYLRRDQEATLEAVTAELERVASPSACKGCGFIHAGPCTTRNGGA